jgi:hypothetical protein
MLTLRIAAFTAVAVTASGVPGHASIDTTPLVFDRVTVIDVEHGRRIGDQRVVIIGNRIRAVGSVRTVALPVHARVIEARGKYLIPGLWDMHTHAMRATDLFYPRFIAYGVTGIRDAWSPMPLDTLQMLRREILAGTRVGPPRQILSGPRLNEWSASCPEEASAGMVCIPDSATARRVVDSLKAAGSDMIKTYALGQTMYFVIAAEARRVEIPFGGHIGPNYEKDSLSLGGAWRSAPGMFFGSRGTPAAEAADSGARIIDHLNSNGGLDTLCFGRDASVARCAPMAARFRRRNTWWVPTVGVEGRNLYDYPEITDGFLHIAEQVGLPILAGTDVMYDGSPIIEAGTTLHAELFALVRSGFTPLDALQAATLNPAKCLHATDSLGTVTAGKLADLVLLDADPFVDITNTRKIRAVVANGRYFDRAALDAML